MNIIQLNSYVTLNGGSETVMSNFNTLFEKNGHSVLNLGYISIKEKKMMNNAFPLGNEKYSISTFFYEHKSVEIIIEKILSTKAELVICHNVYHKYPLAYMLKAIKTRTNAKVLIVFHDYKPVCPRSNLYNGKRICTDCSGQNFYHMARHRCRHNSFIESSILVLDSYYNNSMMDAYSYPDIMISPSQFMADQFKRMGFNHKINVINNPIDAKEITFKSKIGPKSKTLLYAGRFTKDKGIELFIDAAKKMPDYQFLMAGNGELIDKVKKADNELDNLSYLGSLNKEQLFQQFDKSDFLIVPSIWYENNPMIIIEAMIYGLPVLGSNLGGIPELLKDGRGFLFDPNQQNSLTDQLKHLYTISQERYSEIAEKASVFASHFSYENYYQKLVDLIPELSKKEEEKIPV